MLQILEVKYSKAGISKRRQEISEQVMLRSANIRTATITALSKDDLNLLFELYDSVFLCNWFRDFFIGAIRFSLSRRMTKSAGITRCQKQRSGDIKKPVDFEIRIGIDFFLNYHLAEEGRKVCGINTKNSLEALLLVFEHELCHVLEFVHFNNSNCGRERFKIIAGNLFGHTASYHQLPTRESIVYQKLGLRVGDVVSFSHGEKLLRGAISNINKRATVMVRSKDGCYIDKKGNRYSKYYVPLMLLRLDGR